MLDECDNAHHDFMCTDPPNWTTPYNNNASSCSQTQSLEALPPHTSWIAQEQGYVMDVDGFNAMNDDQEQDNDHMRTCLDYPGSNASSVRSVVHAPPPTRFPKNQEPQIFDKRNQEHVYDTQARNATNTHTQTLKTRKRERSPSPASPSPSPAVRLRKLPHNPNLNTKHKQNVRNPKISNINAYAFTGLNRHEAQDEEWSTLSVSARKKAKTKTYALHPIGRPT
jgi:hypothetical protein